MKAIILAAGYATRLYPLTENMPKALLPVANKPIIDYIVEQLQSIPVINEIIVVSNHKFVSHFEQWAKESTSQKPLRILDDGTTTEENRRGAIGDIAFAIDTCAINEEIMVIAGDNLFTFQLVDYYDFYKDLGKDCVVVKEIDDVSMLQNFAVAQIDATGQVIDLVEKPTAPASNIAVFATYIYQKSTIELFAQYLEDGNKPDAPGFFVQWLYTRKPVYAYKMQGECYDVGTLKSYQDVQLIFS